MFLYLIILYTCWLIEIEPTFKYMHQEEEEVIFSPVTAYQYYCTTNTMQKFTGSHNTFAHNSSSYYMSKCTTNNFHTAAVVVVVAVSYC